MKQTCILVLGMHRSGTSALTGVLDMLDIYLGSELLEANFANEKGYFENNILYQVNEKLLSEIDSSWNDTFYNEAKLENIKEFNGLKIALQNEFEYANIFAIKDPRLAFLFPVYKKVLEEMDIKIKIILPYRNPLEVANSLKKRDGMPLEKGMLLWAYHFLLAEKFSRGHERVFLSFDKLMTNTSNVISDISSKLSLKLEEKYVQNREQIDVFLEPSLKHHNISIDNLSKNTPTVVKDVLALSERFNEVNLTKEFDSLRNELFSYQKLFYNTDIVNSLAKGKRAQGSLQAKELELGQTQEALQGKTEELGQTQEALQGKTEELGQTQEALQGKTEELGQTQEALQGKTEELDQTQEALQGKTEELDQTQEALQGKELELSQTQEALQAKEQELKSLQIEFTNIYISKSWRFTRPLRKFMRIIRK